MWTDDRDTKIGEDLRDLVKMDMNVTGAMKKQTKTNKRQNKTKQNKKHPAVKEWNNKE